MPLPAFRSLNVGLRLGLWYSLIQLLMLLGVAAAVLAMLQASLRSGIDDVLAQRAAYMTSDLNRATPSELDTDTVMSILLIAGELDAFSGDETYYQVLDRSGRVLGSSHDRLQYSPGLIDQVLAGNTAISDGGTGAERIRLLAQPLMADGEVAGVLLVGQTLLRVDETLARISRLLGLTCVAVVLISLVSSRWLTSHAFRPIIEVTRVAKQIAATGQVGDRVAVPPARDELYELASTLNDMLERLEQTVARQRQFVADASHELRGPLMVIRGNLDLLQMDLPVDDRRASAREASEEAERMARLVGDLLFLAEQDAHERMDSVPVALNEVVDEVWQRACTLDAGRHELQLETNEPTIVLGDRYRLSQMLWNLVDNALRYTNPDGRVTVFLRNRGHVAELSVADTGISIPAEHVPHIFERYYRVDRERSRNESSTGLGLPIVKQVAEAHGGQVRVQSELGVGTTFKVSLPVYRHR